MGTLEMRTGHLRDAENLLKTAIQHERELAGDSAAVAASMGNYGRLLALTDRGDQALPVLRDATALGARYTGPSSPLTVQNRLFLGEAQLAVGERAEARTTLAAVYDAALAQYGAKHALTLRTQLALARLEMAEGRFGQAQEQLLALISALRHTGTPPAGDLAQALQSLGDVGLSEGQGSQAVAPLQEAVSLREQSSDTPWELAVARERLGEALAAGGGAGARDLLLQAAADLKVQLGAGHSETARAEKALKQLGH
jgi:eukaryotic-like serine/threonine-protein kinase